MLDLFLILSIVAWAFALAYLFVRVLSMRRARRRANISDPEYTAHDNWHSHEDETLNN